jgi:hypothetical protein
MNDRDTRRYEMFNRVCAFGQDHAADFAPNSKAAAHFTALGTTIHSLDQARAAQRIDGSTATKAVLLDALRLDISNVTRTARAIALDMPGFAANYRPPETNAQADIFAAADGILERLQPGAGDSAAATAEKSALVARFVDYELPADFVARLAADRAAVVAAQTNQDSSQGVNVISTAAISAQVETGLKLVANLDAIMHNKYVRDPVTLRAWDSASHTERLAQREKPAPTTPAAAPATATA